MEYRTKEITLPVSGLEATITECSGFAQEPLEESGKAQLEAIPDFIAQATKRLGDNERVTSKVIRDMLAPDQEYLAVAIYRHIFGDTVVLRSRCSGCGEPVGVAVGLDDLKWRDLPADVVESPDPTWTVELPRSGGHGLMGYPTVEAELAVLTRMIDQKKTDEVLYFYGCLRELNGNIKKPANREIPRFAVRDVRELPLQDLAALRFSIQQHECGYDTQVRFRCTHCGERGMLNILLDPGFLFPSVSG